MESFPSVVYTGRMLNEEELLSEIHDLSEKMFLKRTDIAEVYGIPEIYASNIILKATGKKHGKRITEFIFKEHGAGRNVREIAFLTGVSILYVRKRLRESGLGEINDFHMILSKEEIESMINNSDPAQAEEIRAIMTGMSIGKIGEKFGYTRELARQRIENYGLYKNWKSAREKAKHENTELNSLINLLKIRKGMLSSGLSPLELNALEYAEKAYTARTNSVPLPEIYRIFKTYLELSRDGAPSISDVEKASGLKYFVCDSALKKAGVEIDKKIVIRSKDKPAMEETMPETPPVNREISVPRDLPARKTWVKKSVEKRRISHSARLNLIKQIARRRREI